MIKPMNFKNPFASLSPSFYTKMAPQGFSENPAMVHINDEVANLIGIDPKDPKNVDYFSGNKHIPGSEPLAMVYAGHQFGHYAGQLGDGRALLLGQVESKQKELWDIQLKGSGLTPYSRFGDGRAVLRSCIREYLCSEAMHHLGVPTTRALCIIKTGENVWRECDEPGAILTRVAKTHIRFGHFEHFYYTQQYDALKTLADHTIDLYFPHIASQENRYECWFAEIVKLTAELIAHWQSIGFVHGVMNTDNMSILGLTIDYGPFGFMENFDPAWVCNHSDHNGRYVYHEQPNIALWNLYALSQALAPLIPPSVAEKHLAEFEKIFWENFQIKMTKKLGITDFQRHDKELISTLLTLMIHQKTDFTQTFRYLSESHKNPEKWLSLFTDPNPAHNWLNHYHKRLGKLDQAKFQETLNQTNPKYTLRNWVAEYAIRTQKIDLIYTLLNNPYHEHPGHDRFSKQAPKDYQNICVSCSS
jgi:uncharacterized protein YdiU (UPF0061 family)